MGCEQGEANYFNQPLNGWNVSKVTNMRSMFLGASRFNQPLHGWDVSKVLDMSNTFASAYLFNQPLNGWDVSMSPTWGTCSIMQKASINPSMDGMSAR